MKKLTLTIAAGLLTSLTAAAETKTVTSPDGRMAVNIVAENGSLSYSVNYDGVQMLKPSALGITTDYANYSTGLSLVATREKKIDKTYEMSRTKASSSHYVANAVEMDFKVKDTNLRMTLEMHVGNNDIAYRYGLEASTKGDVDEPRRATIMGEASSFLLPDYTTTFICPQIDGVKKGWMSTKPSYEEDYKANAPMNVKSAYGVGYTFPCLFKVGDDGWVLINETGTTSSYCGCHLSDYSAESGYTIAFPHPSENHGIGSTTPAMSLPGYTPWRTITIGKTLKPIVETTIAYDVVEPLYEPKEDYKPGRYTWSWLIWQDATTVYDVQVQYVDLAAEMGYEYCLVDALWDTQIGYENIEKLCKYAEKKGVKIMLWYNSNGAANNAPQGPRNCMNNSIAREKEMAWMEKIGVKGIKVDFFGGDKQQTITQYEDILSDANRHGIQVIFHGCTLPRGWERMYPNFVASEAVLASENVYFSDYHAKMEGFELTMHPFSRNAVASMDWGGTIMNRYMSRDNKSRHQRYTTDVFEMAAGIINQASIQCVAIQPNNLTELPQFEIDFLKALPTTWDETQYIDGYPTESAILARRTGDKWYVAGLNGTDKPLTKIISLPMFAGKEITLYTDNVKKQDESVASSTMKKAKVDKKGNIKVTLQPMGGIIITE